MNVSHRSRPIQHTAYSTQHTAPQLRKQCPNQIQRPVESCAGRRRSRRRRKCAVFGSWESAHSKQTHSGAKLRLVLRAQQRVCMRDALHLTKFANFGRRCPVHPGARNWFSAARRLRKAVADATTHPPPHEIRMSVACLHRLWRGHFLRSSLRRDVAFSPPFLHKAVRVSTTGHQGSQYLLQGRRTC